MPALWLSWALSLALILLVLRVPAKIPFTAPLLPVLSRIARLVGCIIHSVFTRDSLVFCRASVRGNLAVDRTH